MSGSSAAAELRRQGIPLRLSDFMKCAVAHYYGSRDPFGVVGDFVTAPEISQMFGEIIGLWAAVTWQSMGAPDEFLLIEFGPGRGTLMADLLRSAALVPAFRDGLRVHLVETSPTLRELQRKCLGDERVTWHDDPQTLPPGPAIMIANEFFDALPIDHYVRRDDGWHERLVTMRHDSFVFIDGPSVPAPFMAALDAPDAEPGQIFEVNSTGRSLATQLGQRFSREKGAALIIDYGHAETAVGESLQALSRHRKIAPLTQPGEVDLTAHVDFAALARAAAPAFSSKIISQSLFLRRLGIEVRADRLKAARPDQADAIHAACQRLIDPDGMGGLFKVLALASPDLNNLPGFAE